MFKSKLINLILNDSLFKTKPIVLMHLGSAGSNFNDWKEISKNSILVSLDGSDETEKIDINFKKVIKESIIISNKKGLSKFYVTNDPHCSSLLKPDLKINNDWYFSHRFKVKKEINVKTTTINKLSKELGLDKSTIQKAMESDGLVSGTNVTEKGLKRGLETKLYMGNEYVAIPVDLELLKSL